MADVFRELYPGEAIYGSASFPQFQKVNGTNGPVTWLGYDATATEYAFWELGAVAFGGSQVVVDIVWSAATATSGVVRWEASLIAATPETDATSWEAEGFGTATTVDDTHLGTTAKRLMRASLTLTSGGLDSMASGDELIFRLGRVGGNAADTLAGDALLKKVLLTWSDS